MTDLLVLVASLLRSLGCDCDAEVTVHRWALGYSVSVTHEHPCRLLAAMDRRN